MTLSELIRSIYSPYANIDDADDKELVIKINSKTFELNQVYDKVYPDNTLDKLILEFEECEV